jgi:hypothetical protein
MLRGLRPCSQAGPGALADTPLEGLSSQPWGGPDLSLDEHSRLRP